MSCVTYPAIPAIPERLPAVVERIDIQWNSGANSVVEIPGNARLAFDAMDRCVGVVLGIAPRILPAIAMERITHGFYFSQTANGNALYQLIESGRTLTPPTAYSPGTEFEIQRFNGDVSFLVDATVVRRSRVTSTGTIVAACALYASGDKVP